MYFNIIVNCVFIIAFTVHVVMIAFNLIYPTIPSVKVYKKNYHDIDFPITFKLCAIEDRFSDYQRHNSVGYSRRHKFFLAGQSMFNKSLLGWMGHTVDGSTLGSVEGSISERF